VIGLDVVVDDQTQRELAGRQMAQAVGVDGDFSGRQWRQ